MPSRRNPFDEIERLFERMSEQFDDFDDLGSFEKSWPTRLKVDIADHGEEYQVTADLPGYAKEDIDVELADDRLRISAEHESETEEVDPARYVKRERSKQSMNRSVTLPEPVDETGVEASFRNGVLTVTLPKVGGGDDAHRIDIE